MGEIILEKDPVRFRHELKQMINRGDDHILASRLRHIFRRDGNSGADGTYKVTSLYFDTPEDLALRQKTDGTDRREKFHIYSVSSIEEGIEVLTGVPAGKKDKDKRSVCKVCSTADLRAGGHDIGGRSRLSAQIRRSAYDGILQQDKRTEVKACGDGGI